jgi:hypothetical protein
MDLTGRYQRLDRHTALGVLREQGVQDAVADLISNLVWVTLRHRLRGEQTVCHAIS